MEEIYPEIKIYKQKYKKYQKVTISTFIVPPDDRKWPLKYHNIELEKKNYYEKNHEQMNKVKTIQKF